MSDLSAELKRDRRAGKIRSRGELGGDRPGADEVAVVCGVEVVGQAGGERHDRE